MDTLCEYAIQFGDGRFYTRDPVKDASWYVRDAQKYTEEGAYKRLHSFSEAYREFTHARVVRLI